MTEGAAYAIANAISTAGERVVQAIAGLTAAIVLDAARGNVRPDEEKDAKELARRLTNRGKVQGEVLPS